MRNRIIVTLMLLTFFAASGVYGQDPGRHVFLPLVNLAPTAAPTDPPTAQPTPGPTAVPTTAPVPTTVPVPNEVVVGQVNLVPYGNAYYAFGDVVNGTDAPVFYVKVSVRFYNNDALMESKDTYTSLTRTNPGEHNPFWTIITTPTAPVTRVDAVISDYSRNSGVDYRRATVVEQTVAKNSTGHAVFGQIRNDQLVTMVYPEIAVVFYNQDKIAHVQTGYATLNNLAPGATSPYSVTTFRNVIFDRVEVLAEGWLQ